jgi:hypothetical protein
MIHKYKVGDIVKATRSNILGGANNIGDLFEITGYAYRKDEYYSIFLNNKKMNDIYSKGYMLRDDSIESYRKEEVL